MGKSTAAKADTKGAASAQEKEKPKSGNKALTIIGIIMCVILVPILAVNITMVVKGLTNKDEVPSVFGYSPLMVLSGSMEDTIMQDDLIIIKSVDPKDIKLNDIISFFDPESKSNAVDTHRCLQIIHGSLNEATLVIRPESDIHAKAVFKTASGKTAAQKEGSVGDDTSAADDGYYHFYVPYESVGGKIEVNADKVKKGSDERFTITAVPNNGYVFDHWEFNYSSDCFEVESDSDELSFRTKGDFNGVLDNVYIPAKNVFGLYQFRLPGLGRFAYWMQTPVGLVVCIAVPIILLVGYDLLMKKRFDKKKKKDTDALLAELEVLRAQAANNTAAEATASAPAEAAAPAPAPAKAPEAVPAKAEPASDPDLAAVDALIDEITSEDKNS